MLSCTKVEDIYFSRFYRILLEERRPHRRSQPARKQCSSLPAY